MAWFKKKQLCVRCEVNKTKRDFEGQLTCTDCRVAILKEREPLRECPVDGHQMEKLASGEIIIDRCPGCSGIWLDADELEAIKKAAGDEALGAGMVLGMVIN